jgi:hypothetical protein
MDALHQVLDETRQRFVVTFIDYFRGKRGWGTMKRKGFATN